MGRVLLVLWRGGAGAMAIGRRRTARLGARPRRPVDQRPRIALAMMFFWISLEPP